ARRGRRRYLLAAAWALDLRAGAVLRHIQALAARGTTKAGHAGLLEKHPNVSLATGREKDEEKGAIFRVLEVLPNARGMPGRRELRTAEGNARPPPRANDFPRPRKCAHVGSSRASGAGLAPRCDSLNRMTHRRGQRGFATLDAPVLPGRHAVLLFSHGF